MLKLKTMKKTLIVFIIISLIFANFNFAILGMISYAIDNKGNEVETENKDVQKVEKELEIQVSEFCKNDMQEKETNFTEKLIIKLNNEKIFNDVSISDLNTQIKNETEEEKINIFYKTTKINKSELIKAIGETGILKIEYNELDEIQEEDIFQVQSNTTMRPNQENKAKENLIVLPELENNLEDDVIILPNLEDELTEDITSTENQGIITALNGVVEINAQTQADEEGNITIVYPEKTISTDIKIVTEINKIEKLEILHSKIIEKVLNIQNINSLEISKKIIVMGEEELLNSDEIFTMPINYTQTIAELGIDKTQISTSVENKVNFTITMITNEIKYDLYQNPYFVIELPNTIKTINIDNIVILNNSYFTISSIEEGLLETGNKAVVIKLLGNQTEHTESIEENIQIVLETTILTNELIPTTQNEVKLHYQNENVKTYDGIGDSSFGISTVLIECVSNNEIIVDTKAILGDNIIQSLKENYNTVNVESNTYETVEIIGTAINNVNMDLQNVKILGTATNLGLISGIEKIYYTENPEATIDLDDTNNMWTTNYTENAKKYLILIDNFKQGQIVTFGYYMNLPKSIEADQIHEVKFDVYNENEIIKTSKITIHQEAERFDIFEDDKIKANISFENQGKVEVGQLLSGNINITNISGQNLNNISLNINLPSILKEINSKLSIDGNIINADMLKIGDNLEISKINIEKDKTVTISIKAMVAEYLQQIETVKGIINYENRQAQISNKVKIVEPSQIEATLTSNKSDKALEANEKIEYKILLKNIGEAHAKIDINFPEVNGMYIQKIETINKTTGEVKSITAGDLKSGLTRISINSGEIVEAKVEAVARELKKDATETIYAEISGQNVYTTSTNELISKVNKKNEEIIEPEVIIDKEKDNIIATSNNNIVGIAWIDKNQNGEKEANEVTLKGVQAILKDVNTSMEIARQNTNNQGEYSFNNIKTGKYIVEFKYNTNTFGITDYKKEEVSKDEDSDIISTTQNNQTVTKTEVLVLSNNKTENVNAGFVMNKKSDLSINNGITKVTVNNEQGTNEYLFNSTNMAKVEIEGKYLKGSLILVEYEIAVTNSGEINGYAKVISNKVPEGMKFNSELNKDWYEGNDGKLYCTSLVNKELSPGETAISRLILTKEMTDDKIISPVNIVQIEETFNEYLIEDKNKDNNYAESTIIISLTTGKTESYIWVICLTTIILIIGAYSSIKILNKDIKYVSTKKEGRK